MLIIYMFFCKYSCLIRRARFKFESAVNIFVQLRETKRTQRSVTTMPEKSMSFPRRARANVIDDGILDVASSLDVASQGPRRAARVALSNTIFWFDPPTAVCENRGKPPGASHLSTAYCRRRAASRRQPTSQPARGSLRSTFRARTEFVCPGGKKFSTSRGFSFSVVSFIDIDILVLSFGDMWCCKRLDASDWPVTTIVRGNVSCLHVVLPLPLLRSGCQPRLFSRFLLISPSLFPSVTNASSAFFSRSAPSLLLCRTVRFNGEKERELAYLCKRTEEDEGRMVCPRETSRQAVDLAQILARCRIACDERQDSFQSIFFLG